MNVYYGRPCFFASDGYGNKKVSAYIRYPNGTHPNFTHKFKLVWEDDETYVSSSPLHIVSGYRYEVMSFEMLCNILGFPDNGVSANYTMADTIYGISFTAQQTRTLVGVIMYAYAPVYKMWKAALYNSTFSLIAETDSAYYTTGTTSLGWLGCVWFSDFPTVTSGEKYWLCFKASWGDTQHYYNVSEAINQTFTYPSPWAEAFPATLSPTVYYNRTISIIAFSINLRIRGVGDIFPTELDVGWNEISPWVEDIGKNLGEVNASLNFEFINWTIISLEYVNGTRYVFVYGYSYNANIQVQSTNDRFYIYCVVADEWIHIYP
jgi:hypothetical protein